MDNIEIQRALIRHGIVPEDMLQKFRMEVSGPLSGKAVEDVADAVQSKFPKSHYII